MLSNGIRHFYTYGVQCLYQMQTLKEIVWKILVYPCMKIERNLEVVGLDTLPKKWESDKPLRKIFISTINEALVSNLKEFNSLIKIVKIME